MFTQPIKASPYIRAVVEVDKVEDGYSIYAKTNICNESILVEF